MSPTTDTAAGENLANLEKNLSVADGLISKWDINMTNTLLFQGSREEAIQYLAAVDNLWQLMEILSVRDGNSTKMIHVQSLMELSMARLQKEFHKIMLSNSEGLDPNRESSRLSFGISTEDSRSSRRSSSPEEDKDEDGRSIGSASHAQIHTFPVDAVTDLRNIAERMALSGYGWECVRLFVLARNSVVEESLYNLGVERMRLRDVQKMEWELLDTKITKWIYASKISIRLLFASEKRLCDQVFEGFNHMRDSCFAQIAMEPTARLLGFCEAVGACKRSPERLFRVVDMYETLADLMPDMETLYSLDAFRTLHAQAGGVLARLGEAAMGILTEFENAIQKENSKTPLKGGTVHPLTRYVMNYLSLFSDYKETLIKIMADAPLQLPKTVPEGFTVDDDQLDGSSALLSIRLQWILIILQCKLDEKSKLYKDVGLSYLFLTNNLRYILHKVKGSELKSLVGDEWPTQISAKVREYAASYERAAWSQVVSCVREEGFPVGGEVSEQPLTERLNGFNLAIEEVVWRHVEWVVPEEVGVSICEKVIPAYRSFLGRLGNSDMYVKYPPEEVENIMLDLFKGNPSGTFQ